MLAGEEGWETSKILALKKMVFFPGLQHAQWAWEQPGLWASDLPSPGVI